jgi:hypothetical protein
MKENTYPSRPVLNSIAVTVSQRPSFEADSQHKPEDRSPTVLPYYIADFGFYRRHVS